MLCKPLPWQTQNKRNMPRRLNLFQFTTNGCGNHLWGHALFRSALLNRTMLWRARFSPQHLPVIAYPPNHFTTMRSRLHLLHSMQMVSLKASGILIRSSFQKRRDEERWVRTLGFHSQCSWVFTCSDSEWIPWGMASLKTHLHERNLGIRSSTPFQYLPGLQPEELQFSMSWLFLSACDLPCMLCQISCWSSFPFNWCMEWGMLPAIWSPACWTCDLLGSPRLPLSRIQRGRGKWSIGARYIWLRYIGCTSASNCSL